MKIPEGKMKNKVSTILILILALLLVFSCGKKMTEEELKQLADEYSNKEQPEEAIKIYKKLLKEYPDSPKAGEHMFMIGFIYANVIKDYDKGREYYTKFKEQYPDHEFVKNKTVDFEIENLGKEIIIPDEGSGSKDK